MNRHSPDAIFTAAEFNDFWASSGQVWDSYPTSACYCILSIPPAFLASMSGTALYFWFLLSNTAFPWRHDSIGTGEDLGIFFGSLWVLC